MNRCSRYLALALLFLVSAPLVYCQEVDPAVLAKLEQEAEELFLQGEGRMKVASYEDAIKEFRNVLMRYPDTAARYKAQFRMADAYLAMRTESEGLQLLDSIVREESPQWSPRALAKIGDIYISTQKYSEAFRAYRMIITDYPDSPMVDRAHFAIGNTHFRLGHYELAAEQLDKVGLAYASHIPDLQRVSPGQPLYVRIIEPNMVATETTTIQVSVTAKSGDVEVIALTPEAVGGDRFGLTVMTELNDPVPGDGVLQLSGDDTISMSYQSRYIGGGGEVKTLSASVASNAVIVMRDSQGEEVNSIIITDTVTIEINDADRDTTNAPDTITALLTTKGKDSESLTLTETGNRTGIFRVTLPTIIGAPKADSGAIETNAGMVEGSMTVFDDFITISYEDTINLNVAQAAGPRTVTARINITDFSTGDLVTPDRTATSADLEIKSLLYKGKSLIQIAVTYRDLGQEARSLINFRKATEQFQEIIAKFPNAVEVEDAMYGQFTIYVEQMQYDAAITQLTRITQRFPQSGRAAQALFELASLHVKREEYDRALGIYQSLVQRTKGTPQAEEAQYAICVTYMAMFKPKAGLLSAPTVSREQIYAALDEFVRTYPQSERTPEAIFQLVQFRFDGEDFPGAIENARRMAQLYPDHVMTGRVLLLQAQSYIKQMKIDEAKDALRNIIANYGSEANAAERLLVGLERRYPSTPAN